jgi:hypothetical protein
MKKTTELIAALAFALTVPLSVGASECAVHGAGHESHGAGMLKAGKVAHGEVVDGVRVTASVIDMRGKALPKGMKETHHVMLVFSPEKTGKPITTGVVKVKIIAPDKTAQTKDLPAMDGHFGADFAMPAPGRYGVMARFKLADGKVRNSKFWYTVK